MKAPNITNNQYHTLDTIIKSYDQLKKPPKTVEEAFENVNFENYVDRFSNKSTIASLFKRGLIEKVANINPKLNKIIPTLSGRKICTKYYEWLESTK